MQHAGGLGLLQGAAADELAVAALDGARRAPVGQRHVDAGVARERDAVELLQAEADGVDVVGGERAVAQLLDADAVPVLHALAGVVHRERLHADVAADGVHDRGHVRRDGQHVGVARERGEQRVHLRGESERRRLVERREVHGARELGARVLQRLGQAVEALLLGRGVACDQRCVELADDGVLRLRHLELVEVLGGGLGHTVHLPLARQDARLGGDALDLDLGGLGLLVERAERGGGAGLDALVGVDEIGRAVRGQAVVERHHVEDVAVGDELVDEALLELVLRVDGEFRQCGSHRCSLLLQGREALLDGLCRASSRRPCGRCARRHRGHCRGGLEQVGELGFDLGHVRALGLAVVGQLHAVEIDVRHGSDGVDALGRQQRALDRPALRLLGVPGVDRVDVGLRVRDGLPGRLGVGAVQLGQALADGLERLRHDAGDLLLLVRLALGAALLGLRFRLRRRRGRLGSGLRCRSGRGRGCRCWCRCRCGLRRCFCSQFLLLRRVWYALPCALDGAPLRSGRADAAPLRSALAMAAWWGRCHRRMKKPPRRAAGVRWCARSRHRLARRRPGACRRRWRLLRPRRSPRRSCRRC
uniref:Uncharacterized protein n=1 Tax=Siphoviridae sp. ctZi05 TaxID=2826385 RepID=A0A8S5N0G6_9CAUD|nr:MAG TPA: hypothetical protein [Siphoviridae sp. ctZi05]